MKRKLFLIGLAIPLGVFSLVGSAMPTPFPSTGEVYPFFNNAWNYSTLKGTASYAFNWDYNASPNSISLQFRGDIFDLSQMNVNNFSVVTPPGWTGTISKTWWQSGSNRWFTATFTPGVNNLQDPISLQVNYTLLSNNQSWPQVWSQQYQLLQGSTYTSSGTTIPTPEPATLILLGVGLVGVFGFRKRLKK